jgi:hypothetical protein
MMKGAERGVKSIRFPSGLFRREIPLSEMGEERWGDMLDVDFEGIQIFFVFLFIGAGTFRLPQPDKRSLRVPGLQCLLVDEQERVCPQTPRNFTLILLFGENIS